jgi:peptide/nickel transport system permease protein
MITGEIDTAPASAANQPSVAATLAGTATRGDLRSGDAIPTPIPPSPGFYTRSWQRFRADPVAMGALVVLIAIVLFALAAPLISRATGFSPFENNLQAKLTPPFTDGYLLGADGNGRDILTRLAYGGRVSLAVAGLSTAALLLIGTTLGLIAGYAGGTVDAVLMRAIDVLLAVPNLALLTLIAGIWTPGPMQLALVIAAVSWMGLAYLIRGEVRRLRGLEYVEAARMTGASPAWIAGRHVLPNAVPILLVEASLSIPALIGVEVVLSYLGIGVQVPTPSWGNMVGEAKRFFLSNPGNLLIPGGAIYLTSLCLFLVGTGLRDAFDPRVGD